MTAFISSGVSGVIAYADDSTNVSIGIDATNAMLVVNPDTANVIVVNIGYEDSKIDAVVPTSDFNGHGTVIGPMSSQIISFPQAGYIPNGGANLVISVAGVSTTGNAYITLGTL